MLQNSRLWLDVARKLTGRDVTIRFQNPVLEGALGQTYKDENGNPVIDVSWNLPGEIVFKNYLHELAHVKADLHWMTSSKVYQARPESVSIPEQARQDWRVSLPELKAKTQEEVWSEYAEDNWRKYSHIREDVFWCKLQALLNMVEV